MHDRDDRVVPVEQSTAYIAAAQPVGAQVTLDLVGGDHADLIGPDGPAWSTLTGLLPG